jgi:DNA-binding transcriptional MocR family regulator
MTEWYAGWLSRRGEAYSSLADAIEQAIRSGRLSSGARLPTHRSLAKELGVAVSTVSRAYAEATKRGLIGGTAGRGTFVLSSDNYQDARIAREGFRPLERLYLPFIQREDAINLSLNEPMPVGTDERLREAIAALSLKVDLSELTHYQPPQGQAAHRAAGAAWIRELGMEVSPDDVFVVSGGQTALMTVFLGLARPGDTVLTESLTWPGAISVARLSDIRLAPVPMDAEGLVPDAFDKACREHRPRFVYTMPTLHNPTAVTASRERRDAIVRIAREHQVLIVEDDAYGFLVEPQPTYCALAPELTVYLTSLSKCISPALRVGFMVVPPRLQRPLRAATRATTSTVSPILLEITRHLIESGSGREAIEFQTRVARKRQALAAAIVGQAAPVKASFHFWLRLPPDIRNAAFVADALASGVSVTPGDAFAVSQEQEPGGVRICLCAEPDEARVRTGLETLARLVEADHSEALSIV